MKSIFQILPDNFFSPLVFRTREHYASLLLLYYRRFLEFPGGVEKKLLVADFESYFEELADLMTIAAYSEDEDGDAETCEVTPRVLAGRFLRRLIRCGWMSEETLPDFTDIINITSYSRPFIEALYAVSGERSVEYESHIIGIYSSLCSDSVGDNGHHAVMNAHRETRLLIDSLKVLSQNIKKHIQDMYDHSGDIRDILHIHYDLYIDQIVDRAYNRMKTSDNLSRYRPRILQSINVLLDDDAWLERSAGKLAMIKNQSREWSRNNLVSMLKEIRNDLKSLDPIIADIDDKNRRYSRISTEKIKARLYSDESLEQRINHIVKGITDGRIAPESLGHHINRVRFISRTSLYSRRQKKKTVFFREQAAPDGFKMAAAEAELKLRIRRQLNPGKISEFLSSKSREGSADARDIVSDMENYVRDLYAVIYAESRNFPYRVEWGDSEVRQGPFRFREHRFIRQ